MFCGLGLRQKRLWSWRLWWRRTVVEYEWIDVPWSGWLGSTAVPACRAETECWRPSVSVKIELIRTVGGLVWLPAHKLGCYIPRFLSAWSGAGYCSGRVVCPAAFRRGMRDSVRWATCSGWVTSKTEDSTAGQPPMVLNSVCLRPWCVECCCLIDLVMLLLLCL